MNLPPPRVCACGVEVVPYGQQCSCAIERKAASDRARPSASRRGYDRAWQKLRKSFLLAFPTCSTDGCGKPATDVDHIQSIREAPHLRLKWSNLRAFCHSCHSRHTARTQGFARGRGV
ncbi:HNH endonuclease [Aquamicrobium lusatiense]|nr:HNH endonuclease [Aquamicrobium lusatiense]MDH4993308.1 HNH endonuclease [Aquamicrobium lusatiense]